MGGLLLYALFCVVVILAVVVGLVAGYPVGPVAAAGVWAVSLGAIGAVLHRFRKRRS